MKTLGVAEEEEEEEEEKDCCERPCSQARAGLASEAADMRVRFDPLSQPTFGPGRQHQAWSARAIQSLLAFFPAPASFVYPISSLSEHFTSSSSCVLLIYPTPRPPAVALPYS